MENLGKDEDPLEDVKFDLKPVALDFQRLAEMADSERGHYHMQCLVKHWEYKRASDVQALEEELDLLCQQRKEIEQKNVQKRQQILEEQRIHDQSCDTVKGKVPILDEGKITPSCDQELEMDAGHGSVSNWKERAMQLEETVYQEHKMDAECDIISLWKERVKQLEEKLQACLQRERSLVEKTEGSIRNPPSHTQFEGLSALLKMGDDYLAEPENEVAQSMWPENIGDKHQRQFIMENFRKDQDAFKDVKFDEKPVHVDFQRLMEMANSEKGVSHMQYFMKHWEYKRANAARLLEEEIGLLSQQRKEIEQNKQQILEEQRHVPILDGAYDDEWKRPCKKNDEFSLNREPKIDADYDSVAYWKERATQLEKTLEESIQRERLLVEKLEENIKNLKSHTPAEEFSGMLERADYFLHLVLQSAPIVIAHQDADLRYRFVFNHYPTLADEDVIGKTDYEILSGEGIEEMNSVKREVMATGIATKREFVLNTPLFGAKTFLTYIEPVFSKGGETIGVNSVAMDITDQVKRREKMADIRVREAIQNAKETELSRSLHITGQKQK